MVTAATVERPKLTDQEVASLRQMIGYRPEWSEVEPRGNGVLSEGNARIRARIAAVLDEYGGPAVRLPHGVAPRIMRELTITETQLKWHLKALRKDVRRALSPQERIELILDANGWPPRIALCPPGAATALSTVVGVDEPQVKRAVCSIARKRRA
ncbi:hypothetical protein FK268_09340 [Tsukamurella sputi]|uniref:Uncharacterized protein n=1 Tax=Tsukamurella sputi TaxID=2591848 RepID=A0A5C5RRQ3_9ACTN|nr:hypothetical protein [Tsukamurella sputi]TWS25384.1 hypothetical protein FK268_09340 [Tsukamurella sputi]